MDEEEKRALFRRLRTRQVSKPATASSDDVGDEDDDEIDSSSTSSATQSPPPTVFQTVKTVEVATAGTVDALCASSDADTVEPTEHEAFQDPDTVLSPSSDLDPCVEHAIRTTSTPSIPRRTPSPPSSAETVPPPSPGTLARYQYNLIVPAEESTSYVAAELEGAARSARPVIVDIDERGIDGWEEDRALNTNDVAISESALGAGYPTLSSLNFKFTRSASDGAMKDTQLSNRPESIKSEKNIGVLPAAISIHLSSYQRDGVTFLYRLYERKRGGLLADAMGLGKTVQTICFLGAAFSIWDRASREQNAEVPEHTPRILVVAPASVRENWRSEIERWTPFRVRLYESAEQPALSRALRRGAIDILISGDNPLSSQGESFFRKPCGEKYEWEWDVVIIDEIHVARNSKTRIFAALEKLPKKVMFGLTGTAVQNRLKELWNLMSLVVPKTLWPSYVAFKKDFVDIIYRGTKRDASEYMREKAKKRIELLRRLLGKHMVRRPKSIIEAHLPGKTDYCVLMRMKRSGVQGYMYQRFQNSYDVKLLRDAKLPCDCGSSEISKDCCHRFPNTAENLRNAPIWKMHHKGHGSCERCPNCICLYLQHYSRSIAAHALLLMPGDNETDLEKLETRRRIFKYYLGDLTDKASGSMWKFEQEADVSCKLNVALKLLRSFEKSGHKTIIFYESLRLGAILQRWATNKGLVYAVIDGSVKKSERQGAVDRFNTNSHYSIFFISKKAGGTGLNIFGADRVLIFEPCWNPTLDLQAGDRAHRLGQKRVVQIIRLVVENTIEHYVFKTAVTKSQVSSAILDNTNEEWRIRENEIGSMNAMLRMGDVFADQDGPQDDFRVVKAEMLPEDVTAGQDCIKQEETSVQPEARINRGGSQDDVDLFGDETVCSLDVDVDEYSAVDTMEKEGCEAEGSVLIVRDSQIETDELLCNGGASSKLVMMSTSARKQQRQLMGFNETQRTSGINPGGADGIDFDDASWNEIPPSQQCEPTSPAREISELEWGQPERQNAAANRDKRSIALGSLANKKLQWQAANAEHNPGGEPQAIKGQTSVKRKSVSITTAKATAASAKPAKSLKVETSKPQSAFARRARVRR